MLKIHNPLVLASPSPCTHHGVEVPYPANIVFISGQVGLRADGRLAEGPRPQIEIAWRNLLAVVDSAGMVAADLVKVTAYLTRMQDAEVYRQVRDEVLGDVATASTVLIVAGLSNPSYLVEIEAYAAVHIPEAAGSGGGRKMGRAEASLADFGKNFSDEDYLGEPEEVG